MAPTLAPLVALILLASATAAATLSGCGPEPAEAVTGADAGTNTGGGTERMRPSFEPFDMTIDQAVTVGAFVLRLHSARVFPDTVSPAQQEYVDLLDALGVPVSYANVVVAFDAHNTSTSGAIPLDAVAGDGIWLSAGDFSFEGEVATSEVPGLRDGTGTLSWALPLGSFAVDDVRTAMITLGRADQNQVVVPLADPAATVSQGDIPLEDTFTIAGYRDTTIEVVSARVEFNIRQDNKPAPAMTGRLVLDTIMSADASISRYGEYWGDTNFFLARPDGVHVSPDYFNEALYPGDRESVQVTFQLSAPVAGTYTFGVTDTDQRPVTREIIVP